MNDHVTRLCDKTRSFLGPMFEECLVCLFTTCSDLSDNPIVCDCSATWLKHPRQWLPTLSAGSPAPATTCASTRTSGEGSGSAERRGPSDRHQDQVLLSIPDTSFAGCGKPTLIYGSLNVDEGFGKDKKEQ